MKFMKAAAATFSLTVAGVASAQIPPICSNIYLNLSFFEYRDYKEIEPYVELYQNGQYSIQRYHDKGGSCWADMHIQGLHKGTSYNKVFHGELTQRNRPPTAASASPVPRPSPTSVPLPSPVAKATAKPTTEELYDLLKVKVAAMDKLRTEVEQILLTIKTQ